MGDPLGIGPEVGVRALADRALRRRGRFLVHGLAEPLAGAAEACGVEPFWWRVAAGSHLLDTTLAHDVVLIDHGHESGWGDLEWSSMRRAPNAPAGEASFRFVEASIEDALRSAGDVGHVEGIVTAPINKAAWALAGHAKFPGHTDLLARRFGCKRTRMMFVAPRLRVILVTAHIPLMELRNVLTIGRIFDTIDLGVETCRSLGVDAPRVAVCGVNPHAGEDGLMAAEENRLIRPSTRRAAAAARRVSGPRPAANLSDGPQPAQEAVGDARRAARAGRQGVGRVALDLHVQQPRRAPHDGRQVVRAVVVEAVEDPEARPQRRGQEAGARGGADQGASTR